LTAARFFGAARRLTAARFFGAARLRARLIFAGKSSSSGNFLFLEVARFFLPT
jgi:hypothetical protein